MMHDVIRIKANNKLGYYELVNRGGVDINYPESKTRRGRVQDNGRTCPTLCTTNEIVIVQWKTN